MENEETVVPTPPIEAPIEAPVEAEGAVAAPEGEVETAPAAPAEEATQ